MFKSKIITLVSAIVFTALPLLSLAGIPYLPECEVSIAYPGPGTPSLMNVPDGNGNAFTAAHDEQGNVVDATITLYIRDYYGIPVVNFPAEDAWLESADGGLAACPWAAISDFSTDFNGMTQWVNPLFAGGYSQAPVLVFVVGESHSTTLDLDFNSPDIDGNGVVNLADVAHFAGCYFGSYCFAGDLNGDGLLNLADVAIFSSHIGSSCP